MKCNIKCHFNNLCVPRSPPVHALIAAAYLCVGVTDFNIPETVILSMRGTGKETIDMRQLAQEVRPTLHLLCICFIYQKPLAVTCLSIATHWRPSWIWLWPSRQERELRKNEIIDAMGRV